MLINILLASTEYTCINDNRYEDFDESKDLDQFLSEDKTTFNIPCGVDMIHQ